MMIKSKKIIFIFSLILFLFILVGCKNNVTRDNYDKITLYMEKERIYNSLFGFVISDAIGVPVELKNDKQRQKL